MGGLSPWSIGWTAWTACKACEACTRYHTITRRAISNLDKIDNIFKGGNYSFESQTLSSLECTSQFYALHDEQW